MVIQFSIPVVGNCTPCCDPCVEDGTLLDLLIPSLDICGCTVRTSPTIVYWNITSDPDELLGLWEDIPLGSINYVLTTVEIHTYTDECVTIDEGPLEGEILVTLSCSEGSYSLQIDVAFTHPTEGLITATIFAASGGVLDEAITNQQECIGGSVFNVPLIIVDPVLSLAVP